MFFFHIVAIGSRRVGLEFGLLGFLAGIDSSGAVVALLFHIVVFRQWGNQGGASAKLADAVEDDFGASLVHLHGPVHFDGATFQPVHVAHIFQVVGEDNHGEWAGCLVFTEVYKMNAFDSYSYPEYLAGDAFDLAHVVAGILNGDAIGSAEKRRGKQDDQQNRDAEHTMIL